MRLATIGVLAGLSMLIAVGLATTASAGTADASGGECWIALSDPTDPRWSKGCEEIPHVSEERDIIQEGQAGAECWVNVQDPTDPAWSEECTELPSVAVRTTEDQHQEECWVSIEDPTDPSWSKACTELPRVIGGDVQAESSHIDASTSLVHDSGAPTDQPCHPRCTTEASMTVTVEVHGVTVNLTFDAKVTAR